MTAPYPRGVRRIVPTILRCVSQRVSCDPRFVIISKAIACPTRLFLLRVLGPHGCSVSEAAEKAEVSLSTASYHLRHLLDAGLVRVRRHGRERRYHWGRDRWSLVCSQAPPG